jgi:hypothetical protein
MKVDVSSRRLLGVVVASGALAIFAVTPAMAAVPHSAYKPSVNPQVLSCTAGSQFTPGGTGTKTLGNPDSDSWTWLENKGSTESGLSLTFGTNSAVAYQIQASGTVEASVVLAGAKASFTVGLTYTHTDDYSKTATVTVPSKEYGEAGVANIYGTGGGTYESWNSTCKVTSDFSVSLFQFPTSDPAGYITDTTKSAPDGPPWALAPS